MFKIIKKSSNIEAHNREIFMYLYVILYTSCEVVVSFS